MRKLPPFDAAGPAGCMWLMGAAFVGIGLGSIYEPGVGGLAFGLLVLVAAVMDWIQ